MSISKSILPLTLATFIMSSCAIIRPGEVGVKQRLGKLSEQVYSQGPVGFNPFTTKVIKAPTRTVNMEVNLNLPSKEGLNINSEYLFYTVLIRKGCQH